MDHSGILLLHICGFCGLSHSFDASYVSQRVGDLLPKGWIYDPVAAKAPLWFGYDGEELPPPEPVVFCSSDCRLQMSLAVRRLHHQAHIEGMAVAHKHYRETLRQLMRDARQAREDQAAR